MAGGLDVNYNYSWPTGSNTQLGIVPTQIMPGIREAFRFQAQMIRYVQKDLSFLVANAGDTIVYEKLTGSPTAVDFTSSPTDNITYQTPFTLGKDSIVIDRYIGFPFVVRELEQLLPTNSQEKWDSFIRATSGACADYLEADIAALYTEMSNSYNIDGGINKSHFPILEDRISYNSFDNYGPWILFMSRHDFLNLTSDTDLQNQSYAGTTQVLRDANIFKLSNINALRWRHIIDVDVSSSQSSSYNKLYHNILMSPRAIQIVPRRLGVPKMATSTLFVEIMDRETGVTYRLRFFFNPNLKQPGWQIVLEILYGIKLYYDEYAMDVTTLHLVP
jgi:hypothetical protein